MNFGYRFSRLLKGGAAQLYSQGVTIFLQLSSVPVLLHYWGASKYGAWLLLSTIPTYLSLADLGFAQAATNDMTLSVAADERERAATTFQSISIFVFLIFGFVATVTFLILLIASPPAVITLSGIDWNTAREIIGVFTIYVLLSLMFGVVGGALRSEGRFALMIALQTTARFFEGIGVLGACSLGLGPLAAAASLVTARAFFTIIATAILLRDSSIYRFGTSKASAAEIKRLVTPSLSFLAFPIGNAICIQGVLTIVGLISPPAIAIFSSARTLSRLGTTGLGTINHIFLFDYSSSYHHNIWNFRKTLALHFLIFAAAASVYVVFICLLGLPFYKIWTNHRFVLPPALFGMLIIQSLLESLWALLQTPVIAVNKHSGIALNYIIGSVVAVVAVYVALSHGQALVCAAIVLSTLFAVLCVPILISLNRMGALNWSR